MHVDATTARAEWALRVGRQAEQMLVMAGTAADDRMRAEFLGYAKELKRHAAEIREDL